jgi:hypothetical protein
MRRRTGLVIGILMLIIGACTPGPSSILATTTIMLPTVTASLTNTSTPTVTPTDTSTPTIEPQPSETQSPSPTFTFSVPLATVLPTRRAARTKTPTDTPTATVELQPSEIPSPTPTPTLACERETASILLSVSTENAKVGDSVKVTVTVNNEGCLTLGLPQYRLYVQSDGPQSMFTPENPEPVVHYLGVDPGQFDAAEFDLTAVSSGQATLTAMVSYEVHLGFPGPAYWGAIGTREPLIIAVAP